MAIWPGVSEPAALLGEIASWLHGYGNRGTRVTYAGGLGLPTTAADVRDWIADATPGLNGAETAAAWRTALAAYLHALGIHVHTQRESTGDRSRTAPPPAPRGRLRALHWFRWCAARGLDPARATTADVKAWLDALDRAGAAPATRDRLLGTVKALYAHLADTGLTSANPAALNRRRLGVSQRASTSRTITLTAEQVRLLHDEAGRVRQGVSPLAAARAQAVVALLTLGLRVSELVGLDRGDVTVTRGRTALHVRGKGGKIRVVYVSRLAHAALATYLEHRDGSGAAVVATRSRGGATEPLVATTSGTRLTRQGVWHLLRRIATNAGEPLAAIAPLLHPHALRHFYVTAAVEAGAQLVHVQADVGHTSADTTEQVYNAAARDPSRSAVDLVADAIAAGS